jgi:hypothetical protein
VRKGWLTYLKLLLERAPSLTEERDEMDCTPFLTALSFAFLDGALILLQTNPNTAKIPGHAGYYDIVTWQSTPLHSKLLHRLNIKINKTSVIVEVMQ